jgi:hypothetical protein
MEDCETDEEMKHKQLIKIKEFVKWATDIHENNKYNFIYYRFNLHYLENIKFDIKTDKYINEHERYNLNYIYNKICVALDNDNINDIYKNIGSIHTTHIKKNNIVYDNKCQKI